MIFSSFEFIFLFLPITIFFYFQINKFINHFWGKIFLVLASLFFYGYWNPQYVLLILLSCLVNFRLGSYLIPGKEKTNPARRVFLIAGIAGNLLFLGFFKYFNFLIQNVNFIFHGSFDYLEIILPLAISFFTFQQIAYLVDSYRGKTREYDIVNYFLFVTFFPQLIAGPIVHHSEVIPQFENTSNRFINYDNLSIGFYLFAIGLFKKAVIADSLSLFVDAGYKSGDPLTFIEAWIVSLSYTFQLYFDFSGYTDMGLGAARMMNIVLPQNFLSPYKSLNIQEFWKRWHITLGRWLSNYLYIPLGGNRLGSWRTYRNLMITFLLGGFWHGAGWTFIIWGFLHGLATVCHRIWKSMFLRMPRWLAWFITFQFVNAAWVFFRAPDISSALQVFEGMLGLTRFYGLVRFGEINTTDLYMYICILPLSGLLAVFARNSFEKTASFQFNYKNMFFTVFMFLTSLMFLNSITPKEFLYFDF